MTAPGEAGPPRGRPSSRPESDEGSGARSSRGALLEVGVYTPRPRRPLGRAVRDALGRPTREEAAEGLDLAQVWARPELHRRLVARLAEDAGRSGAGRIVAPGAGALAVAAPVALRLGWPLRVIGADGTREPAPDGPSGDEPGGPAYLVACVLHDEQVAGPGHADPRDPGVPPADDLAGAATIVRIRGSDAAPPEDIKILSVIEL